MKKVITCVFLLQFISFEAFASGNADQQSQALLYQQKRTTWKDAPESAAFYECYLVKRGYNDVILLDIYLQTEFLENPMLIVNHTSSMGILVYNESAMLKLENTIYKCVVLASANFMGMAIVNVFSAEPINIKIGYVMDRDSWRWYEYSLLFYDDRYIVVSHNDEKITILDQWPNPAEFKEISVYKLLEEGYNKCLQENKNLTAAERSKLKEEYENQRNKIPELLQGVSNAL
jgi:hypothetical protein